MGYTQAIMDRIDELRQGKRFFEADREAEEELWRKSAGRRRIAEIDAEIERLSKLLNQPETK